MKICSSCEIVLEDDFAFYKCPIRGCCGEVIEIDDNILETYKILNRKGYITLNSCAGHVPTSDCCSPSTYISFMNDDFI